MTTSPAIAPALPVTRPKRVRESRGRDFTWLAILGLTMLAAVLRFASIEDPVVWVDEAAVAWRTCGTFGQLIEILRNDGFVPLHYEYYWAVKQFTPLTPFVLRLLPTIAGIAMVPAMYFLAVQLVDRRTALVAAAFTAVSGHIGWHAQDAKMYSHFWLMCVLSTACLLWWIRTGSGTAFWSWTAASVAMVGLHSLGWAVVAVEVAFFVVRPRREGQSVLRFAGGVLAFAFGLALIAAGPLIYYQSFNRWGHNIETNGWTASGIAWVSNYFGGSGLDQVSSTMNHFLFGYGYPPPAPSGVTPMWVWHVANMVPLVLLVLLVICLFPFPRRHRGRGVSVLPMAWWRTAFCLGVWVLLPTYAFYCASFAGFAWPLEVIRSAASLAGPPEVTLPLGAVLLALGLYFCAPEWRGRLVKGLQLAGISAGMILLAYVVAWQIGGRTPGPVWVSRYVAVIWPAFVISIFALLGRLPIPPVRWAVVGVLLGVNLYVVHMRHQVRQDAPLDLFAKDFVDASQDELTMAHAIGMSPREQLFPLAGRYYLFLYSGRKTQPWEFAGGPVTTMFKLPGAMVSADIHKRFLDRESTRRIIVWQNVPMPNGWTVPPIPRDKMLGLLPEGWRCVSEDLYPFRSRWALGGLQGTWSRREFHAPEVKEAASRP